MQVPAISKGAKLKTEVSCVAWVDLLGYGAMLAKCEYDPTRDLAKQAVDRIQGFQDIGRKKASRTFSIFGMNDAAIAYHDLSPRTQSVTFDTIRRSIDLYDAVNKADIESGFPGARMV